MSEKLYHKGGRPVKKGLDYAYWPTNVLDQPRIEELLEECGSKGWLIYFAICQRAYATTGYYYELFDHTPASVVRMIGARVTIEDVKEVIGLCLDIGLFSARVFVNEGVLTSAEMQETFLVAGRRRVNCMINPRYSCLVSDAETGLHNNLKNEFPRGNDAETGVSDAETGVSDARTGVSDARTGVSVHYSIEENSIYPPVIPPKKTKRKRKTKAERQDSFDMDAYARHSFEAIMNSSPDLDGKEKG